MTTKDDKARLVLQEKTIKRMQRQWDELDRKNTELQQYNTEMFDYIVQRCNDLIASNIMIENNAVDVYLFTFRREFPTRIDALEFGEALVKVLP